MHQMLKGLSIFTGMELYTGDTFIFFSCSELQDYEICNCIKEADVMYIILELQRLETSEYITEFRSGIGKGCRYGAWTSST